MESENNSTAGRKKNTNANTMNFLQFCNVRFEFEYEILV
jgi:hypothetical protein